MRVAPDSRDSSPAGVLREIVIEALCELGEGRWLPWSSLGRWLKSDARMAGLARLLRRWAERGGLDPVEPIEVARRIVHDSLPNLGILDLGEDEDVPPDPEFDGVGPSLAIRLTARGRALLADKEVSAELSPSKFLDTHVLRIGNSARIGAALAIAPFVEVGRVMDTLDLVIAPQMLARALSAGVDANVLRTRIEAVAPLPDSLSRTLAQASVVVGRGSWVGAGGFVWIEDASVRELLRTRRPTQDLFVDPSPPGGLLVAPGVDLDRLSRRCRTLGVEILADGQAARPRSTPPPSGKTTPAPRPSATRAPGKVER